MKKIYILVTIAAVFSLTQSCQNQSNTLTIAQKEEIIELAKTTVQKVFEHSNSHEFVKGLDYYSNDSNSYYISNGTISSLKELKTSYNQIGKTVEVLENNIDKWNVTVLAKDLVVFTLPVHLKIKLKGIPEYNGQLVWSGIVKNINNSWVIVHSHESWLNCAEVASALTPQTDESE